MLFRDLCTCNKDWEDNTDLIIISKDAFDACPIRVRAACTLFGSRQVLWYRDCVVMLL